MKKILIAYENKQHPIEMDISKRSEAEIKKIKTVLKTVGRTWKIKDSNCAKSRGLHLHSMIAITPDGLPLGVMKAECSTPKEKDKDDKRRTSES